MTLAIEESNNHSLQFCVAQYQNALDASLSYRCHLLTQLFANSSLKELKYLFPKLVEDIFGFRNRADWGLVTALQASDCHAIEAFLAPDGPLLQLAYKLLSDHHRAHFEFPISCLPALSRHLIEVGDVPALYAGKIQRYTDRVLSSSLQLNSFQFFVFHFAYFIVRPPVNGLYESANHDKAVYSGLLEKYLKQFLPTEGSPTPLTLDMEPPSPPSPFRSAGWSPPNASSHGYTFNNLQTPYVQSPLKQKHSLLKPGIAAILNDSPNAITLGSSNTMKLEDWRAEEFVAILSEMYLNQISVENPQNSMFVESYVPNQYHVYMVRMLIKHAHLFSNSLLLYTFNPMQSPLALHPMGPLKSSIFPRYIQKDMHAFLKIIFDRWPLDASFQVPLEMWLSYIQPWRYSDARMMADWEKCVHKWQKFVSDNLHFYTSVFIKALSRFSRMDLSCPHNAFMLFRVCKVFAQENLDTMVVRAEQKFHASNSRSSSFNWSLTSYSLPQSHFMHNSSVSSFHHDPSEFAGYVPLFSEVVISQVSHLLREIASTRERISCQSTNNESTKEGFFSRVFSFFALTGNVSSSWSSDSKKLNTHLHDSMEYLCKLFKLPPPSVPHISSNQSTASKSDPLANCFYEDDCGQKIPIMKNLWAHSKNFKPHVTFQGNPDFLPVRTYEYQFLVKAFTDISAYVNSKYAQKINELYNKPSLLGRMCQQLLAPPTTFFKTVKSKDMMSVQYTPVQLPPRVCLRYFANKYCVFCFFLYLAVMYYFDFHLFPAVAILVLIFLFKVFVKAVFHLHKPEVPQARKN